MPEREQPSVVRKEEPVYWLQLIAAGCIYPVLILGCKWAFNFEIGGVVACVLSLGLGWLLAYPFVQYFYRKPRDIKFCQHSSPGPQTTWGGGQHPARGVPPADKSQARGHTPFFHAPE